MAQKNFLNLGRKSKCKIKVGKLCGKRTNASMKHNKQRVIQQGPKQCLKKTYSIPLTVGHIRHTILILFISGKMNKVNKEFYSCTGDMMNA